MPTNNIKLVDENDNEIIGIELLNGEIGKIKFVHSTDHQVFDCTLPLKIKENEDETNTFILKSGKTINRTLKLILDSSQDSYLYPKSLFPEK